MFAAAVMGGMSGVVSGAVSGVTRRVGGRVVTASNTAAVPIIAKLASAAPSAAGNKKKGPTLAQAKEINAFLASVERRAFKHAAYAVRDDDAALDIVQDSMMKLTESYADKPANELPMLFTRILQNTILDHFRRTKTRNQYVTNFSSLGGAEADDDFDVLEILESQDSAIGKDQPLAALEQGEAMGAIEEALAKLPARQREAFLLRYWEDMDTAETAATMGCSEGSVKTHCSRAVHALQGLLRQKGITL
jgi:RNA polymerase sigma-70 factor, ECF subfamily